MCATAARCPQLLASIRRTYRPCMPPSNKCRHCKACLFLLWTHTSVPRCAHSALRMNVHFPCCCVRFFRR